MAFALALLLSFGPAFGYASVAYWVDRYEKEPKTLLVGVFAWGAIVAVVGALIWGGVLESGLALFLDPTFADAVGTVAIAPIVEESVKGLAVLIIFLAFRHEFDTILDGLVYAGITALGFAATENVLYLYFAGYSEDGYAGLFGLFVLRVIIGGWNHAVYTSFTGIGFALARLSRSRLAKVVAPPLGLLLAIGAHALHNGMVITLAQDVGGLVATVLIDWLGWVFIFAIILWALGRERRWNELYLRDEVALGTLSAAHYRTASSGRAQTAARWRALTSGRYRATWRFYQLCGELAQKKHLQAQLGENRDGQAIERLRAALRELGERALT